MTDGFDSDVPSPARMYDYYLGGRDNFAADREAAEAVIASHPEQRQLARNNRAFLVRAVEHLAAAGITQFVDVGTGIPTSPTVHEVARRTAPDARVVYVDDDPVVLAHARALLAEDPTRAVVEADMHDPAAITTHPDVVRLIDPERPVAVLFVAVLHFSAGDEPRRIVEHFRRRMARGSYLVISAGSSEGLSEGELAELRAAYARTPRGGHLRTRDEIAALFDGFELVEPGLVDVCRWRGLERPTHVSILAGVGRLEDGHADGTPTPT
ncbi:SAM-dependent methyltransferase [Actinomycetospora cinnamomea]|uniref:S-adenosyl methyltransferase n=1 Tax=Actinomycetospora cinnamomea TaxID=663609 RepID=A0A2U1FS08_9PSEU|nr:SAM-dependent methyltransferase [Actinomycetospora cinnamomea]PVZ14944.1 S-adenosyl methyltransferase [Actinomycetospora cinnamomea]